MAPTRSPRASRRACAESAHLNVDEGGAPEAVGRMKLLTVATPDGKLTPEHVAAKLVRLGEEHVVQPGVVSVTQSTELGTLYTPEELRALADHAHANGMRLRGEHAEALPYLRKQSMHLASKMRYVAAQFEALLTDGLWERSAAHANAMAARLAAAVGDLDGVRITQPVQANVVFAILPPGVAEALQRDWGFYTWDEHTGEVRWMCSWDTRPEDVDAFAAAIAAA